MTDTLTLERRSENMRRIKAKGSSPEMAVRRMVHALGYRYRLHVANLPGRPDIVLTRLGKIIEVRGCFWHQHRGCIDSHIPRSRVEYWKPKLAGNVARDRANQRKLRAAGWQVLVLWACETGVPDRLAKKLEKFLTDEGG